MCLAILRPGEVARAEWGVEHQIIHDLIISLTDRLLAPASPLGELKQVDLLIIERAAQDRESDCGRQKEYRIDRDFDGFIVLLLLVDRMKGRYRPVKANKRATCQNACRTGRSPDSMRRRRGRSRQTKAARRQTDDASGRRTAEAHLPMR